MRDPSIENASGTVLTKGDVRLHFILMNDSPGSIVVTGISSPAAQSGEIIGACHHWALSLMSDLVLEPDEEMDFSASHLKARLTGVADIVDVIVFQVLLNDGAVSGEAHVH